jgi:hypothetical protein
MGGGFEAGVQMILRRMGLSAGRLVPACLALLLSGPVVAQDFAARLGRTPVDTRTQSSTTGRGEADAHLDGDRLTITGRFAGMQGPATAANLHIGQAVGVRGPIVQTIEVTAAAEGDLKGTIRLSAEQIAALKAGRLYIQVNSESAPEGNLWGWLLDE